LEEQQRALGVNVSSVCARAGMSRQNYYAQRKRRRREQVDEALIEQLVQRERQVQPRIGGRKLHRVLKKELEAAGLTLGRDRFFEILRQRQLLLAPRPAAFPRTTHSQHYLPVFTNRIKDLKLTGSNQVWVSDVTYVRTVEGFLYLSLITDKWSRKVVGYYCADTLETQGCLEALEFALKELPEHAKPVHHSDRGSQYCCHQYVNRLKERQLGISMTESDHCAENALAERINGILKGEYSLDLEFQNKEQARCAVLQAVHLYNTRRLHTALGYRVPAEVHALAA
jgi:transposase InsO family protein